LPVSLATINSRKGSVTLKIEGETLLVTYNRSALTPEFQSALGEETADGFKAKQIPKMLHELLVEWDLMNGNGKPYPITEAALAKLPTDFLQDVALEIFRDLNPSPNSETPAPSGSFS